MGYGRRKGGLKPAQNDDSQATQAESLEADADADAAKPEATAAQVKTEAVAVAGASMEAADGELAAWAVFGRPLEQEEEEAEEAEKDGEEEPHSPRDDAAEEEGAVPKEPKEPKEARTAQTEADGAEQWLEYAIQMEGAAAEWDGTGKGGDLRRYYHHASQNKSVWTREETVAARPEHNPRLALCGAYS